VFKVDNKYTLESFMKKDERSVGTAFDLSKDDMDVLLTALTGKSQRDGIEIVQEALDD
jgi:DNA-directed RNA polymerase specialized sigma24 family protein